MGDEEKSSLFERHIQTVIVAVLLAILLWTGNTLLDIRDQVTTMKVQVITLQAEVRLAGEDKFRVTEWRREKEILDARMLRIERIIERHFEFEQRQRK